MPAPLRHAAAVAALLLVAPALVPPALVAQPPASGRAPAVHYVLRVSAADTSAFEVEMRIRGAPAALRVAFVRHPEYDDRFWRFVDGLRAEPAGRATVVPEPCDTLAGCDRAIWNVRTSGGAATLRWRVTVPFESRPRGSWRPFLAPTGALVGGPHAFPYVVGAERARSTVALELPDDWRVATALRPTGAPRTWAASSVEELVESPILAGRLREWRFAVRGVPHRVAWWPKPGAPAFDTVAFVDGLRRLAHQADSLFGGMPYREYTFLMEDEAYGGLEHPSSVTIGAPSEQLARDPQAVLEDAAHEFVHTWNLMAIRPIEYAGVTWEMIRPVPTLWWFEGLTMHYADVLRRRAGLADSGTTRLSHLEGLLARYLVNPAYARFSPESISRVEYNAPPAPLGDYDASTHLAGEILGNALDLMIRERTDGRRTIDDAMRLLYRRSRGATRGIEPADLERAVAATCGCDVRPFFNAHVRGTTAVDMAPLLRTIGLELAVETRGELRPDGTPAPDLRVWATSRGRGGPLRIGLPLPTGVWGRAGLHSGDVVTAINGTPVHTWPEFRAVLGPLRVGDSVRVALDASPTSPARTVRFVMAGYERPIPRIRERANAMPAERARRARWLAAR